VSGSGISWAICKFFTGRMPFLPPNQQRQSTEGCSYICKLFRTLWGVYMECSSSFLRSWALRLINHWRVWCMAIATPNLQLPSQLQGITAIWLIPNYTTWWQRHVCNQLARGCYLKVEWLGLDPVNFELWVQRSIHFTTRPLFVLVCCAMLLSAGCISIGWITGGGRGRIVWYQSDWQCMARRRGVSFLLASTAPAVRWSVPLLLPIYAVYLCHQCFDAVGWVSGRSSGL